MPRKKPPRRWCSSLTVEGRPCEVPPREGEETCIWHNPDKSEADRLREIGGLVRKAGRTATVEPDALPEPPSTPEQVEDCLRWAFAQIACGELDAVTGRAVVDSLEALHKAQTARLGLQKRAKALEQKLAEIVKERAE